jgi:hypothetical protein
MQAMVKQFSKFGLGGKGGGKKLKKVKGKKR